MQISFVMRFDNGAVGNSVVGSGFGSVKAFAMLQLFAPISRT